MPRASSRPRRNCWKRRNSRPETPGHAAARYLSTLNVIAGEKNSTIIFPFPMRSRHAGDEEGGFLLVPVEIRPAAAC